ncbi:MAG: NADH-quinone oxidoreductase subunit J [Candidatus Njordarchaeia archaeon]
MDIMSILELGSIIAIIIAAIYTAEAKPVSRSIGGFMLLSLFIGFLYLLLDAPIVAAFQVTIYSGAVAGLLLLAISLTKEEIMKEEEKDGN